MHPQATGATVLPAHAITCAGRNGGPPSVSVMNHDASPASSVTWQQPALRRSATRVRGRGMAYRWRIAAWRLRIPLLVITVAAVPLAVSRPAAPVGRGTLVTVAAHPITVGQVITSDDLRTVRWPGQRAPSSIAIGAATGQRALVAIAANFPVDAGMVATSGLRGPDGTVVVPIELPASWATLLAPGARITIMALGDDGTGSPSLATPVATGATVLRVDAPASPPPGGMTSGDAPLQVAVAVEADQAPALTIAALSGDLGVVLVQ